MSITVSIKVKKEVAELADEMVRLGIARSRSQAINIMIEKGIAKAIEEVRIWKEIQEKVKKLRQEKYRIERGDLWKLLEEGRSR